MKTGDNVYCVKDYVCNYPQRIYEKGKNYKINAIIEFDRLDHHTHKANIDNTMFSLSKDSNIGFHLNFYEYFITEQELRKLKLQKINKI